MSNISKAELIQVAAEDMIFFGSYFFPRAVSQDVPGFHIQISNALDSNEFEKIAVKVFRGGAKTTLARIIAAKRIAYGISRTILIVSAAAEHAYETVKWLKHAVERQDNFARTFGLQRGDTILDPETKERYTWRDDKIQIINHSLLDENGRPLVITVVGTGLFGQSRGLNIEDKRPDFILLDDVIDEDNAGTPEQRKKVNERIYGAIVNTLAPRSECPTATILFVQTPIHQEDAIEMAKADSEWLYLEFSCFDERGESRWPTRFPTEVLRKKKQGFINRNQLSLWMREMEVTVTSDELALFVADWFLRNKQTDDLERPPRNALTVYMGVDPTPPPKEAEQRSSDALRKLDTAVIMAIGIYKGHVYELESYGTKSPLPNEFINKILEIAGRWNPICIGFESVLFARTTKFYLEQAMVTNRSYYRIQPIEDKRKKSDRIRQSITDIAFENRLHLLPQGETLSQALAYPDVKHDDYLDALSIALMARRPSDIIEGEYEVVDVEDADYVDDWRGCPSLGSY